MDKKYGYVGAMAYENCLTCGAIKPNGEDGEPEQDGEWEKEHDKHCKEPRWKYIPTHFEMLERVEKLECRLQDTINIVGDMGAARQHDKALEARIVDLEQRLPYCLEPVEFHKLEERVEALEAQLSAAQAAVEDERMVTQALLTDKVIERVNALEEEMSHYRPIIAKAIEVLNKKDDISGLFSPPPKKGKGYGVTPSTPEPEGMKDKPRKEEG